MSRRLLQVTFTLLVLSLLAFGWRHGVPGGSATQLDPGRPVPVQYARFVAGLLRGDLGRSLSTGRPVAAEIGSALPATAELVLAALVLAAGLGVPLGHLAAGRRSRRLDHVLAGAALVVVATPVFVLGDLLRPALAARPSWLPAVVLPAVALAVAPLALIARAIRGVLLDQRSAAGFDRHGCAAVSTCIANGLVRPSRHHLLRTLVQPLCGGTGLPAGTVLVGALLVEKVFGWGGVGMLVADAITARDYPRLEALLLLGAVGYVLLGLLADLSTALLDRRVRTS
ncbi:ABC transporter permease [Pseudonocardia sp. GCM10023141]|uniref:ABC transporter permease n=1 Tax=Pseudonocardia sp. GCM10023141 TaxID=3252653 RepID=UPI003619F1AA